MDKDEVAAFITNIAAPFPERNTGNEINAAVVRGLRELIVSERAPLLLLVGEWINRRPARADDPAEYAKAVFNVFLGLYIAAEFSLAELAPDIRRLVADVEAEDVYLPYYAEMIARYLRQLERSPH